MRVLILNGSPKGENSITLQTVLYIAKHNPEITFDYLHVGAKIRSLEKDFSPAEKLLATADLVVFAYPVYTFLVPSQLHRFVELLKEHGDLQGKFVTQITTSKHFYDMTAHRFIEDNARDLGMRVLRGLSADMDDLTCDKGRKDALAFFEYVKWSMASGISEQIPAIDTAYSPCEVTVPDSPEKTEGDVVIVTDLTGDDGRLDAMIQRFRAVCALKTRVVDIGKFPFRGGCLSCFSCAANGKCVYTDGFDSYLRENIQSAQAIMLAFTIRDHSMGARFKMYDDRQFCNGHRTVTMGKPFGYLIRGAYSREENLRTVITARAEVGGNYLCGTASDEFAADAQIDALAAKLVYAVKNAYTQPANFYGVGGMKIFRDLIWLMQGMMRADHRFYKKHGQYDFPQKQRGKMFAMYAVGALMNNEKLKRKAGGKINEGMLAPYKKAMEK